MQCPLPPSKAGWFKSLLIAAATPDLRDRPPDVSGLSVVAAASRFKVFESVVLDPDLKPKRNVHLSLSIPPNPGQTLRRRHR